MSVDFQSEEATIIVYWSQLDIKIVQIATVFSLYFSDPSSMKGSFSLYISLWIIFTLHLLIIRNSTWVLVPSDTLSNSLWVAVVKVTLFRGILHINAARKVVAVHLMWWWSLLLDIFRFLSFSCVCEVHLRHWNFLEGRFNCWIMYFDPYSLSPRRMYSSNDPSFALY